MKKAFAAHRSFILKLALFSGLFIAIFYIGIAYLASRSLLPALPIVGTDCIDQKLAFLREADWSEVNTVAVGSSVTWRNLDMAEINRRSPGTTALNAAPCYLSISQTAFLADLILAEKPKVTTVIAVVAPRDFEACAAALQPIADPDLIRGYVFRGERPRLLYAANFRPLPFARDVLTRWQSQQPGSTDLLAMDETGSSPLDAKLSYMPPLAIDEHCFASIDAMEAAVTERGARFVLVSLHPSPEWRKRFDPSGQVLAAFERTIADRLRSDRSQFVSTADLALTEDDYADAVHLMKSAVPRLSAFVAEALDPGSV